MKTKKNINNLRLLLTIIFTGLLSCKALAQEIQNSSVSIFGNSSGCGSNSNTLNLETSIGSSSPASGISTINDYWQPLDNPFPMANATYSPTGQLVFSTDKNGIYNPDGSVAHDFTAGYSTTITTASGTVSVTALEAISDVAVFPCQQNGSNKSYYAVFWATTSDAYFSISKGVLRIVQVNTNDAGAITSCVDHVLYDATSTGMGVVDNIYGTGNFLIASDFTKCGNDRAVYTIEPYYSSSIAVASKLRKWIFPADGSLPSTTTSTYRDIQYYNAYSPQAKIMTVDGTKYFAYVGTDDQAVGLGQLGYKLLLWDISHEPLSIPAGTANTAEYTMGIYNPSSIFGFEHPGYEFDGQEYLYVSYQSYDYDISAIEHSGLAYFTPVSRGNINYSPTLVAGTEDCGYTDLQQDKNKNLIMVAGMPTGSNGTPNGTVKYLTPMEIGMPAAIPHTLTCSGGGTYSVASRVDNLSLFFWGMRPTPFYLWKPSPEIFTVYPKITDIDISTHCAPGYNASSTHPEALPQYSVSTSINSMLYSYLWTPMPPLTMDLSGFSVTIPRNGVNLDNYNTRDPKIVSLIGGGTPLTAAFILTVKNEKGCPTNINVNTPLMTSGFDLATRDSHFDLYDETNQQATVNPANWDIWNTQDIWNRYQDNGAEPTNISVNQSPGYPSVGPITNYLYTYVKNVGCADYIQATTNAKLHTYWTMGGFSAETWANAWNGIGMTPATGMSGAICDGTQKKLGSELTSSPKLIGNLAVGEKQIISTTWNPPNPYDYYPPSCTPSAPNMELCLLSRIVDGHNSSCVDGMTICENTTGTISANVRNNNNIATLNTNIIYVTGELPKRRRHIIIAGNGEIAANTFSIQMANHFTLFPGTGVSNLSQYINIDVELGDLFDKWVAGGSKGTYSSINYNTKTVSFDGTNSVRLDNIVMDAGAQFPIAISFNSLSNTNLSQLPTETVCFRQLFFDKNQDTIINTLYGYRIDSTIDSTTNVIHYDTIPVTVYDTTYREKDSVYGNYNFIIKYQAPPKGVLAVTEISNGPSSDCEYAEIVVANCGADLSPSVDISEWILDDNSGNFNTEGCKTGVGIAQGHYRLSNDGTWSNVPVGSVIVLYNYNSNCYSLPDSFKTDTTTLGSLVYWLPIGGSVASPYKNPHVERFGSDPSVLDCSYCGGSDSNKYTTASSWTNTIGLNNTNDAFQVRCPGCSVKNTGEPNFYHGIGYGPASGTDAFTSIPASENSIGGAVKNENGSGKKFVFNGLTVEDLANPAKWSVSVADYAGSVPSSLGNINSLFENAILSHQFEMQCCGKNESKSKKTRDNSTSISSQENITVYPNPANNIVYFSFPLSEKTTIRLLDVSGRLMQENTILNSNNTSLNTTNYAPGVYIYQVLTDNATYSGKIIVQN